MSGKREKKTIMFVSSILAMMDSAESEQQPEGEFLWGSERLLKRSPGRESHARRQ